MQPGSPTTMLDSANPFPQDSIGIKELLIAGRIFFAASLRSFQHVGGTTEVFVQGYRKEALQFPHRELSSFTRSGRFSAARLIIHNP